MDMDIDMRTRSSYIIQVLDLAKVKKIQDTRTITTILVLQNRKMLKEYIHQVVFLTYK